MKTSSLSSATSRDVQSRFALVALIPDLRRLALRLTRDRTRADDLVHETLLRVWAMIERGQRIDDLKPYLMQAARNLSRRPLPVTQALEDGPEPETQPEAPRKLALRDVARRLAGLPDADARVIMRHAADGDSYAEIARCEGVPIGTVMSRLARARMRLRADCGLPGTGPAAARLIDTSERHG